MSWKCSTVEKPNVTIFNEECKVVCNISPIVPARNKTAEKWRISFICFYTWIGNNCSVKSIWKAQWMLPIDFSHNLTGKFIFSQEEWARHQILYYNTVKASKVLKLKGDLIYLSIIHLYLKKSESHNLVWWLISWLPWIGHLNM